MCGYRRLRVAFAGHSRALNVYVVRDGGPPLLGRDFISLFNLQLVPVNYCDESSSVATVEQLQQRYPELFAERLGTFNKYKIKLSLIV